ncbi:MAG: hypothetical protein OHK93_002082 [Ramalina farinacea]|uniref:DUF7923 domain-containing protein n=1 Tax=Ramalina farinacea TaxID=258253 RepID=A0AA43U020_9LECA|nr:hypothetical protein [Ramalina farinacea]
MTDQVAMQVDDPAPTSEPNSSGTPLPDKIARSLNYLISNLKVSNEFARFKTERIHRSYAESVKARYLSPETSTFTMAHEQIAELLHLLGEERDLTNSLQERLDTEIILSQSFELGAQELHQKHTHAMEAVDDLRSQKEQMLTKISHLETLCGERYERIALVERELQKAKSVSPESQGSMDMEIGGVSLTATTENESCKMSSPGQNHPKGYAVCLIDGDHLPFAKDVFYTLGGGTTAQRLTEGVRSLLQDDEMDLRVAIYVDTDRIAPAMARSQVLHSVHDFRPFAKSFNSASPSVEMVDTRSPERVTQKLKLHLEDPKCEFILFGGWISRDLMSLAQHYEDIKRRFYAFSKPEELTQPEHQDYIIPNPLGHLFCQHPLEFLTPSHVEPKPPVAPSQVEPKQPSARSQLQNGPSVAHPQIVHKPIINPFNTTTTQDTTANTATAQDNSNTSTSFSSPASGRAVVPATMGSSNAKVNSTGIVAAHWSRMRDEDEPTEDRPDLFAGRQSSWRQY